MPTRPTPTSISSGPTLRPAAVPSPPPPTISAQPSTCGRDYAAAYHNRGMANADRGDDDAALADFSEAIRLAPDDPDPLNGRGVVYARREEYDEAIADFDAAIDLDPQAARVFFNRANAYAAIGDDEKALADYDAAIRLPPAIRPRLPLPRHDCYARGGRRRRGHRGLLDGPAARPAIRRGVLPPRPGVCRPGRARPAVADLTRAIALEPDNAAAYNLRGIVRADAGDLETALADFTAALDLNPEDYGALFNRGLTHLRRSDLPAALDDFNAALAIRPDDDTIRLYRGGVADDLGDTATAIADCDAVLDRNPEMPRPICNAA